MNKLFLICFFMLISTMSWAQDKVEMADVMRSNGKIYTVVAVCLTILTGLFVYVSVSYTHLTLPTIYSV